MQVYITVNYIYCEYFIESWKRLEKGKENSRNNGLHTANLLRRTRGLLSLPESWWSPFSGIHKVWLRWIPGEKQGGYTGILCRIIWLIRRRIVDKTAHLVMKIVHRLIGRCKGHIGRRVFVSKFEIVTYGAGILVEWGGYRLFCRPPENVFFRRAEDIGASWTD